MLGGTVLRIGGYIGNAKMIPSDFEVRGQGHHGCEHTNIKLENS
jgi:hypothetical protein